MRSSDFLTTEEIVAEGVEYLADTDFTHGIGRSFYELIVHRAIEELAISTFFQKVTIDIFNWNCDGRMTFKMPANTFNLKEIYFFNSSCDSNRCTTECETCVVDDCCSSGNQNDTSNTGITSSENRVESSPITQNPVSDVTFTSDTHNTGCGDSSEVGCCKYKGCWTHFEVGHYAVNFNRFGSTGIKTKERRHNNYIRQYSTAYEHPRGYNIYFGMQNGDICVSDSGKCYKNARIVANGFGTDNCDLPIIPRELRGALVDLVKLRGCARIMLQFPEYQKMYQVYKGDLYGDNSVQNPGSWLKAERFVKSMNSKQREDFNTYFGNITIK